MKINETPIRTSKNYSINSFEVPDGTFSTKAPKCEITHIAGCNKLQKFDAQQHFPLCKEAQEQLLAPNNSIKVVFDKNSQKRTTITNTFNKNNNFLACNFALETRENISANAVIFYKSSTKAFANSFLHINCKPNSALNVTIVSDLKKSQNFLNIEADLAQNAVCNLNIVDFCDTQTIIKQTTSLLASSAKFDINMLYLGTNKAQIDINIINNIFLGNSSSNINVVGALFDSANKNFKGTIDFKQGATKSKGTENELCLLFSPNAKSKALPILLAGEEDVDGSHSSATSKIDGKQLFYLMSRGLSKLDSMKLYLKAKFNNILSNLDTDIQKYVNIQIDRKLKKYE